MSTVEDFENAPIGATATHREGTRAVKTSAGEWGWFVQASLYYDNEEMANRGFTLDPLYPNEKETKE